MASLIFDDIDVFYLLNSFSVPQLRHEIHAAEVKTAVAEALHGTEYQTNTDLWPWPEYAECCREAIRWKQVSRPKTQPAYGHVDIEGIKANNDIVAVIERYTTLRKSGRNFVGRCPIHEDKHPSLTVYPEQQSWYCYSCSKGGDILDFIQVIKNTDFKGAAAILGGR